MAVVLTTCILATFSKVVLGQCWDLTIYSGSNQINTSTVCEQTYITKDCLPFYRSFNQADLPQEFPRSRPGAVVEKASYINVLNIYNSWENSQMPGLLIIWNNSASVQGRTECYGYLVVYYKVGNPREQRCRLFKTKGDPRTLQYRYNVTYVSPLQEYSVRVYSLPPFGPEHKNNISTFVSYQITTKDIYSIIPGKWSPLVNYQVFPNGTVSFNLSLAPAHLNLTMFRVYIKKQSEPEDSVFSEVCNTENTPKEDIKCVFTHTVEESGNYYITAEAIDKFPKVNGLCQCWIYNPQKVCDNCTRHETSKFYISVTTTLEVPECRNPHIAMMRMPETIGPEAGPIMLIGPQTGEPGILSRLRDHDLDSYFRIQAKGGNRSEVYLTKTLNVDFIRDVDRLDDGELVLPFMVTCRCVKCHNANGPVVVYHGYLIVTPVDNYPPEFNSRSFNISEDTPIGSIVGNMRNMVIDRDFPDYTRLTRFLLIEEHGVFQALANGDITLSKALDYEAGNRTYRVLMSATNNVSQTADNIMTVNVINVNDSPVKFVFRNCLSKCMYVLNTSAVVDQDAGIRAVDADNDPIEYSIVAVVPVNETDVMTINKTTGRLRQFKYPDDRHLRILTLTIKARVTSPLPPARITHGINLDEDFANLTIYFESMSWSVSGGDQLLAGDLHVLVCLIMIYGISKHVI